MTLKQMKKRLIDYLRWHPDFRVVDVERNRRIDQAMTEIQSCRTFKDWWTINQKYFQDARVALRHYYEVTGHNFEENEQ